MRTHRRISCMTTILGIGALSLSLAGCGKSNSGGQSQTAQPSTSTQQHAAPIQNPLTSGTTSGAMGGSSTSMGDASGTPTNPHTGAPTGAAPTGTPAGEALNADASLLEGGTRIDADGISFVVPPAWEREAVTSSMRAAQYKVPATGEGEEGTFVVFRGIGGTPEENIERWIKQLSDQPSAPQRQTIDLGHGLTAYTVQMTGTYTVGTMMGGSGSPEPDTMFLGAVITGGPSELPIFFRLTGPRVSVEPRIPEWNAVLASTQPASHVQ